LKYKKKQVAVVFDFDDTLVWSEKMKRSLFRRLFPQAMLDQATLNAGDRYQIIRKILGKKDRISEKLYDSNYLKKIKRCKKRRSVSKVLKFLELQKISVLINSATPQDILRQAVQRTFQNEKFAGIFGGFGKKRENLKWIRSRYEVLFFVGDTRLDKEIASVEGVPFLHARYIRFIPKRIMDR
jgi:phosphoglycolate phosphatase-like HAD superfamily hydrolase